MHFEYPGMYNEFLFQRHSGSFASSVTGVLSVKQHTNQWDWICRKTKEVLGEPNTFLVKTITLLIRTVCCEFLCWLKHIKLLKFWPILLQKKLCGKFVVWSKPLLLLIRPTNPVYFGNLLLIRLKIVIDLSILLNFRVVVLHGHLESKQPCRGPGGHFHWRPYKMLQEKNGGNPIQGCMCVVREKGVKIAQKNREKGYPNRYDQSSSHAIIPGKGR